MIDRKQLKFAARGYIKAAKPSPWTVSMIACIITEILSVLAMQVQSPHHAGCRPRLSANP